MISNAEAVKVSNRIVEVLRRELGAEMEFEMHGGKLNGQSFVMNLRVTPGNVEDRTRADKAEFVAYCNLFGMTADMFGKTIKLHNGQMGKSSASSRAQAGSRSWSQPNPARPGRCQSSAY